MKLWKTILLQAGIFTSVFALGAGAGFLVAYNKDAGKQSTSKIDATTVAPTVNEPLTIVETPKDKFLNNLVTSKAIEGDITLNISRPEQTVPAPARAFDLSSIGDIELNVKELKVSFADLENIKLDTKLNIKTGNLDMTLSLAYFDGTIFLDYEETHFYLKTTDIIDGILMIPNIGVQLSGLLSGGSGQSEGGFSLDFDALTDSLKNIEEHNENGEHYFLFDFTDDIKIKFMTNDSYQLVGVELPDVDLMGFSITATSSIHALNSDIENFVSPLEREGAPTYCSFKPAFTLAADVMRLINTKKANVAIDLNVDKKAIDEDAEVVSYDNFLNLEGDVDFDASDLSDLRLNADLTIDENNRHHAINAAYQNQTIYATYGNFFDVDNDLNISITNQSVESLISYIDSKLEDVDLTNITEQLGSVAQEIDLPKILTYVNDLPTYVQNFSLTSTCLSLTFDSTYFKLPLGKFDIAVKFNSESIKSISVTGLTYEDFKIDVKLSLGSFNDFQIDESKYVKLDPAVTLVEDVENLINSNSCGIDFNINIADEDDVNNPVTLDGTFQFKIKEIDDGSDLLIKKRAFDTGAGNLHIVDKDNVHHRINAYAKSTGEVLLDYDTRLSDSQGKEIVDSNKMYATFNYKTIDSIIETISRITNGEEANASALINNFMGGSDVAMPITEIMKGNYGLLLETKILNSLDITDTTITAGVNGALLNMDTLNFTLVINFSNGTINSVDILDLNFGGKIINIHLNLGDFDQNTYDEYVAKLPDNKNYLDISSVATLLEIGINTTEFNYYKITGTININMVLTIWDNDFDIKSVEVPVTIEILNVKNHVKVYAKFVVPEVSMLGYQLCSAPTSYLMYDSLEGMFYTARYDTKSPGFHLFGIGSGSSSKYCRRFTLGYMTDNILGVLLGDVFGMADSIMDMMAGDSGIDEEHQMTYDNLINNYSYVNGKYSLNLNLAELAGNEKMGSLGVAVTEGSYVTVNEDETETITKIMSQITASFDMNLALSFNMNGSATLNLVSYDKSTEGYSLSAMDEWMAAHGNDELNKQISF